MKQHFYPILSIILISLWLGSGLFHPGWFSSHDGIFHVRRAAEMVEQLKAGFFPVRYAPTLDNNYGIPLFNYIYPGPYYLTAIPNLLFRIGIPTILKFIMLVSLAGGAFGWYCYFKDRKEVAWVVAVISLFTPYFLVNIYVRTALGETIALALLPWAFLVQSKTLLTGKISWFSPLPLFLTLISHNFIGYFVLPVLIFHLLMSKKWRFRAFLNLVLGLGLASFFWLPMFFERQYLLSGVNSNFSFAYTDHFVVLWQFILSHWGYGYSLPGVARDGFTFQIGFAPLAGLILAISLSLARLRQLSSRLTLYFCLITLFFIFCMTRSSAPLWELIPLLSAVQFPWRLLGLVGVLTPLVVGLSLENIKSSKVVWYLGAVFILLGASNTYFFRAPAKLLSRAEFSEAYALWQNGTTTSYRDEIVPRWSLAEHTLPSPEWGTEFRFKKEVAEPTLSTFPKNYFPSWRGEVDGKPMKLSPSGNGEISFPLLIGSHEYHLYLGSTNTEKLANFLSLLSIATMLVLMRYTKRTYVNQ